MILVRYVPFGMIHVQDKITAESAEIAEDLVAKIVFEMVMDSQPVNRRIFIVFLTQINRINTDYSCVLNFHVLNNCKTSIKKSVYIL